MKTVTLILCLCNSWYGANASNILGLFLMPAESHYTFVKPLLEALANRGHNLTIYTAFPDNTSKNYSEFDVSDFVPVVLDQPLSEIVTESSMFALLYIVRRLIPKVSDILQNRALMRLLNSSDEYDLILTDNVHTEWFTGFAFKFKAPRINIYPNYIFPWFAQSIGATMHPAYMPLFSTGLPFTMTFREKLYNTLVYLLWMTIGHCYTTIPSETLAREVFGEIPPLAEIAKNTSMTFTNTFHSLYAPHPVISNVVEVGGMHIVPSKKLPKDLENFINNSKSGVVLFSMGSLLRGDTFSAEKLEAFLYAFSMIPHRVIWKWEGDILPGKLDNIMISKRLPQRDVLAHPNVKLFISQGGLLSISEAIYEGVPILGIPIFGDQRTNIKLIVSSGIADHLDYNEISKKLVLEKIQKLLNNPKYKENAKQLSLIHRDRPMSPLDTAIYWTEYIIRHKGAVHLKSPVVDMEWYEYLLCDVTAFLIVFLVGTLAAIYCILKFIYTLTYRLFYTKNNSSKQKEK